MSQRTRRKHLAEKALQYSQVSVHSFCSKLRQAFPHMELKSIHTLAQGLYALECQAACMQLFSRVWIVWIVIWGGPGLAFLSFLFLCSVIGPYVSRHFHNQSDSKLKPISLQPLASSRASGNLLVFTLSSLLFLRSD